MKSKIYFNYIYLLILGGLSSLSLPPYNFVIINIFTYSLFFLFIFKKIKTEKKFQRFLYGWFFGFGYFLTNIYWITISLTFDSNFKFLIVFALILIPSFLAIFYGLAIYLFFLFNINKPIISLLIFSLSLGFFEFLRGTILTGFPWNLIVYSLSNYLEILQILSLLGTYALNMLCLTFFASPALFILRRDRKEIIACILFIALPIVLFIYGSSKIDSFQSLKKMNNDLTIRAIGSNIDLERFYGNVDPTSIIEELIDISSPNLNMKTLFLWPEGIIPKINQKELKNFEFLFKQKFNENHFFGIGINNFEKINDQNKFYNSFTFYDNELNLISTYNKVNLVPFGEFLPFEKLLSRFGLKSLTNEYQSFHKGKNREVVNINRNSIDLKILPLICYEIIYSGKIFDNFDFDYIINISEDGWFGNSNGPYQHFSHSIFRSIESGKYLIRSANNGITAVVNPTGFIEKKISLGNSGYIDFSEKKVLNTTLFAQHGNKMFLYLILLYIFLIFSFNRIL
ncbi:apolipoprotein N-acyltransferase [Candidatus Pelagibacter communis]|uniref:apolipoprotein N-acyltransferase n=1 Tax=Pelagibacter ubique TaxID=198252 RepID=UPI000AB3628E|nr:apolipoprotein N-acyltransferase [Candidatus Pelagibacter ubique]